MLVHCIYQLLGIFHVSVITQIDELLPANWKKSPKPNPTHQAA